MLMVPKDANFKTLNCGVKIKFYCAFLAFVNAIKSKGWNIKYSIFLRFYKKNCHFYFKKLKIIKFLY